MREWLVDLRHERGLAGTDIARSVGISQAEYSRIETGARTPRPRVAKSIAALLGCDWTLFYDEEGAA